MSKMGACDQQQQAVELAGGWINGHALSPISGFCSCYLVT